jgi:hypothetical protein
MAGSAIKYRFGVGNPDGKHSMVWTVCIHRSDLYLFARCLGRTIRASIHATLGRLARLGHDDPCDRWTGAYQFEQGASLEFLIRFPTAELRRFPLRESDLKRNVTWLTPALGESEALEVALIYFPPEAQPVFTGEGAAAQLVCTTRLFDSKVWLVARVVPARLFLNPCQAFGEIAEQMRAQGVSPSDLHDGVRLIVAFNDSGVRGLSEMAGDSVRELLSCSPP